jgi:hypothetical protein
MVAGLGEGRALELAEALARHSLIEHDSTSDGPRCRMLETVRVFVAERLAGRANASEVQRRHAGYYRGPGRTGRTAPAPRWPRRMAGPAADRGGQPGRRRRLVPRSRPRAAARLVLRPAALLAAGQRHPGSGPRLDRPAPARRRLPRPAGPRRAAVGGRSHRQPGRRRRGGSAASQELAPLLTEIDAPYLHAVCQLAMAWAATIVRDSTAPSGSGCSAKPILTP